MWEDGREGREGYVRRGRDQIVTKVIGLMGGCEGKRTNVWVYIGLCVLGKRKKIRVECLSNNVSNSNMSKNTGTTLIYIQLQL